MRVASQILISLGLALTSSLSLAESDPCPLWFKSSGLLKTSTDCEEKCSILPVDLGTFDCHNQCDEFCGKKGNDKNGCFDPFWQRKIKDGKPKAWPGNKDEAQPWSEKDRRRISEALERQPELLKIDALNGIYRMKSILGQVTPGAQDHDNVVFYDRAFNGLDQLSRVVSHELAHELYRNIAAHISASFERDNGWSQTRDGKFVLNSNRGIVTADSVDSPDEDFANAIEYFLYEPNSLKLKSPKVYEWLSRQFGPKLKLNPIDSKGCKK